MLNRFSEKFFRICLAATIMVGFLWLYYDAPLIQIKTLPEVNVIYASDDFVEIPSSVLIKVEPAQAMQEPTRTEKPIAVDEVISEGNLNSLKEENAKLFSEVFVLEKSKQDSETKLNNQITSLAKAKEDVEAKLNSELASLGRAKEETEQKLSAKISASEKEKTSLNQEISELTKSKQETESKLNFELANLNKERNSLQNELSQVENNLKETENKLQLEISSLRTRAVLTSEVDILNKAKKELEDKIREKISSQAKLEDKISSLQERVSSLTDKNSDLKFKLTALNASISVSDGSQAGTEALLKNETASNQEKESQIEGLKSKIVSMEKEDSSFKEGFVILETKLNSQIENLKNEKRKIEEKLNDALRRNATASESELEPKRSEEENKNVEVDLEVEPSGLKEPLTKNSEVEIDKEKKENINENEISGSIIEKDSVNREIWVDFVKNSGVIEGQVLSVFRGNVKIAELKVIKIFDSFTVTKTMVDKDFDALELFDKVDFLP